MGRIEVIAFEALLSDGGGDGGSDSSIAEVPTQIAAEAAVPMAPRALRKGSFLEQSPLHLAAMRLDFSGTAHSVVGASLKAEIASLKRQQAEGAASGATPSASSSGGRPIYTEIGAVASAANDQAVIERNQAV